MCYYCRISRKLKYEFCSVCGKHLNPIDISDIDVEDLSDSVTLSVLLSKATRLLNYSKKFLSLKSLIEKDILTFSSKDTTKWYWSSKEGLDNKALALGDTFIEYQDLCYKKAVELLEFDGWKSMKDKQHTYKKDDKDVILSKVRNPLFYVVKMLS